MLKATQPSVTGRTRVLLLVYSNHLQTAVGYSFAYQENVKTIRLNIFVNKHRLRQQQNDLFYPLDLEREQ